MASIGTSERWLWLWRLFSPADDLPKELLSQLSIYYYNTSNMKTTGGTHDHDIFKRSGTKYKQWRPAREVSPASTGARPAATKLVGSVQA
jgi:hypothetical protein